MQARIIGRLYQHLLKPILFLCNPETMHDAFTSMGHSLGKYRLGKKITRMMFHYEHPLLEQFLLDLVFTNPVGLAAGFDKDIQLCQILPDVGFGFTEVGSITYKPYDGNPKPRLYRLIKSEGLIVYYGLKNQGIDYAVDTLTDLQPKKEFPIIVSVAKTNCKDTVDTQKGLDDYISSLQRLHNENLGDIYDINVSCPNAFGGENFADPEPLEKLLTEVDKIGIDKPVLVKLPVDKTRDEMKPLIDVCLAHQVDGVVIANLTKQREAIAEKDAVAQYKGGISGKPVRHKSEELIGDIYKYTQGKLVIVGVGGVFSADDAYEKIKQGASLIQLITGMIFNGPQVIGEINKGIVQRMQQDGYKHLSEAIGAYHRG